MAEVEIKKSIKIILSLTENEAIWLKGLVQNPINNVSFENENERDKSMRSIFWDALCEISLR